MADEWIKVRTSISIHPHVVTLASRCNVTRVTVIGALVAVWSMADTHSEDGLMRSMALSDIDAMVEIPGFAECLESVGWLKTSGDGVLLPRYTEHNGPTAKKRCQDAKRQSRKRHGPVTQPSRSVRDLEEEEEEEEEAIHPEEQDKDKEGKDPEPEIGSDGWMAGKSATDMLKRVGVNGNNLKVLGSHKDITQGAVRTACRGLANEKVRSRPAVLVQRLVDEFGIQLGKGPVLDAEGQKLAKTLETQRRKR